MVIHVCFVAYEFTHLANDVGSIRSYPMCRLLSLATTHPYDTYTHNIIVSLKV